jgi:opacity protein-like surface antigen
VAQHCFNKEIRMKHTILAVCALALGIGMNVARADADKGLYLGAGVGQFNVEVDNLDDAQDTIADFDADDTSLKAFAGYRFNPYFAVELDYIDFGGPEDQGVAVDISGFAPYLVGTLPLGIFELFAQVGYLFYDFDVKAGGAKLSDSTEDLVYGAGAGLVLFDHLDVRVTYEIIDAGDADDANALWLTGAWRF